MTTQAKIIKNKMDILELAQHLGNVSQACNYVVSNKKIKQAIGQDLPLASKKGLEITAASFAGK